MTDNQFEPINERETPDGEPIYGLHPMIFQLRHELSAELGRKATLEEVAAEWKRRKREFLN